MKPFETGNRLWDPDKVYLELFSGKNYGMWPTYKVG